jgi:hypothetical protein
VVKLVHATWDANASCAPPECSRTRSTCKVRALDTGDIRGCKKWSHFTVSGLVRQNLAVPAPIFRGLVRLQANLPRAFAAPRSHANVSINHQCPPPRNDPRAWGNNARAATSTSFLGLCQPMSVGPTILAYVKCVSSPSAAGLILARHPSLISLIRHQSNMGFSNDKKADDVEYGGSHLKPEDTNPQGQTDAVFGEIVEGGPNYRSVCSHAVIRDSYQTHIDT